MSNWTSFEWKSENQLCADARLKIFMVRKVEKWNQDWISDLGFGGRTVGKDGFLMEIFDWKWMHFHWRNWSVHARWVTYEWCEWSRSPSSMFRHKGFGEIQDEPQRTVVRTPKWKLLSALSKVKNYLEDETRNYLLMDRWKYQDT